MMSLRKLELEFKGRKVYELRKHCEIDLFTIDFHCLNHMYEELNKYGSKSFKNASKFIPFNADS